MWQEISVWCQFFVISSLTKYQKHIYTYLKRKVRFYSTNSEIQHFA